MNLAELEPLHQSRACSADVVGRPDDLDNFVDVVEGDEQPFDNVGAGFGLREPEAAPPLDDFELMGYVVVDHLGDVQRSRDTVDQGYLVDREVLLELGVLEEQIQNDLGVRILPQLDHETSSVSI